MLACTCPAAIASQHATAVCSRRTDASTFRPPGHGASDAWHTHERCAGHDLPPLVLCAAVCRTPCSRKQLSWNPSMDLLQLRARQQLSSTATRVALCSSQVHAALRQLFLLQHPHN